MEPTALYQKLVKENVRPSVHALSSTTRFSKVTVCDEAQESYLAALTRTDAIVVSRGLVLADEAGLVDSRRGWRGWWAGDKFLRTGALCFDGCKQKEGDEEGGSKRTK